jgi:hypothetical protein
VARGGSGVIAVDGLGGIVRRDARDERSATADDEIGGLGRRLVGEEGGDGSERFDLVRGVDPRVVEAQEHRRDECALGGGAVRAVGEHHVGRVGRTDDETSAGGLQGTDLPKHLLALPDRGEGAHRHALGAGVSEHGLLREAGAHGLDHGICRPRRHDRAPDRRALLPGLRGHLGHELPHVRVELRGSGDGVRAEHRGVDGVGLRREAHTTGLHRRMQAEALRRRGAAREGHEVAEAEVIEQRRHTAADDLEGTVGEEARIDEDAHHGGGDVARGRRRLDQGRHSGEERRSEFLERPPHREVEGVDLHGDPREGGVDVPTEEGPVLRQRLDRPVDVHGAVRKLPASLARVGEEHADPAVDVDPGVGLRRPGARRERVQLVLALRQRQSELLEQHRPLMEGERGEARLSDRAAVFERGGEVEPFGRDTRDDLARGGIAHLGGLRVVVGCPPGALHVARKAVDHRFSSVQS